MLREPRTPWPARVDVALRQPPVLDGAGAAITFIGHATFLIQTPAGNLLTDPMYSQRASPLTWIGPRRVRQPAVAFDDLPHVSTILLSHNHYDHCDLATLRAIAKRFNSVVVTPLGDALRHVPIDGRGDRRAAERLNDARQKRGIEASRFRALEFGESMRIP